MLSRRLNALIRAFASDADRLALVCDDGAATFGELGRRVGAIAAALETAPPGVALVVGHKEVDVVAAMIACACAGRGFAFAEAGFPAARIDEIARTCDARVVVEAGAGASARPPLLPLARVACAALPAAAPPVGASTAAGDDDVFYVTFTSGSTGAPKGVPITRGNFEAFQHWFEPLNSGSRGGRFGHAGQASFAFDMSMSDMWTALFARRALFLLARDGRANPRAHLRRLSSAPEDGPGTMTATPAFYALMLEDPRFRSETLPRLRTFWVGGESVSRGLLARLLQAFPGAEILHGYGPSEATCITHWQRLEAADLEGEGPLPLGPARNGVGVRVLDASGVPRMSGMGEIVLTGPQVAGRYLPAEHAANASFGRLGGEASYRTGNLGLVDARGVLYVHGRSDRQVKVNGFRIELAEIERRALEAPGVSLAIAVREEAKGCGPRIHLVAQSHLGDSVLGGLRTQLKATLPDYMQPSSISIVLHLPLADSGKVDRHNLQVSPASAPEE